MRNWGFIIIAALPLLFFQNCAKTGDSKASPSAASSIEAKANFEWLNENLIEPKCVSCHNSSLFFGGFIFTSYDGVMDAIVPGEPENSPFYTRSFSTTFFTLTDEERDIIYLWIENGATD